MAISRQALFGKLGVLLYRGIESSTQFCKLRGNPYVELVHWLHQILQLSDSDLHRIVRHAGIDRAALDRDCAQALAVLPAGASAISDFSWHIEAAIERAWVVATLNHGDRRVRGAWLIAALFSTPDLKRVLLSISPEFAKVPTDRLGEILPAWIEGSPEGTDAPYDRSDLASAASGDVPDAMVSARKGDALEQYCTDLTARARAGAIDPVIGREIEVRTMVDVLLRRRQNNPLLTGEAGVGKTAVVEGLANAIVSGHVPPKLADVRVLSLDVGALLAGASLKGEFESRLKGLLDAVSKTPTPVILFIDEIHTLVGAGGQAGTGDAANLLKPALARGTIRTIGATTWAEYKRHIEKDPALTRRFQVLQVTEPSEAAAVDMVRGLAQTFAQHHGVVVRDEAIRAAVTLSHRYIPSRQLPDKAISLLDTACARVALSQHAAPRELDDVRQRLAAARTEETLLVQEARIGLDAEKALATVRARIDALVTEEGRVEHRWREQAAAAQALLDARANSAPGEAGSQMAEPAASIARLRGLERALVTAQDDAPFVFSEVDQAIVAKVVSDWTGVPTGMMMTDAAAAVRILPETLAQRVLGQTDALRLISQRVQTAYAGLTDPKKPLGVFLLAGPSGVGKTETALALAQALYGGEQNLITVNMSEYQEAHTVSGLKGAPPGYVGYGEGGVLTEAVRRRPYSVVLLDEVEKAHRDVHEMFFQVFDKGYMEDGDGRYIDFRNTTILLTSNAGSDVTATLCAEPSMAPDMEGLRGALAPELLKIFPAAFLGRVCVVPYRPLAERALAEVVRLHLDHVARRMSDSRGIALSYDGAVIDYVVGRCHVQETGARVLIGFIEQHLLPRLSALCLDTFSSKQTPSHIAIGVADPAATPQRALTFQATCLQSAEPVH
ncbi:type VI secretion system ATPase TssH [Bordetella sp. LUAb4]|uniref:type VI secretion system ATPase TssH n=1 Tax=Bordetella sp. LUAb4 TaxID=2843195 RepID=UPI001E314850|nr:type VI secretion system ATPase TssH [Bordetella sp. LUAb4]